MELDALQRWLTLVTLVSAALAGLVYLSRQVWRGFKLMERLAELLQHELSPNSGTSMKDDVAAIAVAVGQLQADFTDLIRDVTDSKLAGTSVHELLQLQLDDIHHELGHRDAGQHRAGQHRERNT
jgi:hypothetical protein